MFIHQHGQFLLHSFITEELPENTVEVAARRRIIGSGAGDEGRHRALETALQCIFLFPITGKHSPHRDGGVLNHLAGKVGDQPAGHRIGKGIDQNNASRGFTADVINIRKGYLRVI